MMTLTREQKNELVEWVQSYFYENRGEEIGIIAAEDMLDAISNKLGPYYYNAGVEAARKEVEIANVRLEEELFSIKKSTR